MRFHTPRLPVVLVALALAGCPSPPGSRVAEVAVGVHRCDLCGEPIRELRFAAQYRRADGAVRRFDDPGCLFRALRAEEAAARDIFFHEAEGDRWVAAEDAWFAQVAGRKTPRGYGWLVFADFAGAQAAVSRAGGGRILPWAEARNQVAREERGRP